MTSYPYLAKAIMKYKTPHDTDLSFAKDEEIQVTGQGDEDEDWLKGESIDGSRNGGFPKAFVVPIESASSSKAEEKQSDPGRVVGMETASREVASGALPVSHPSVTDDPTTQSESTESQEAKDEPSGTSDSAAKASAEPVDTFPLPQLPSTAIAPPLTPSQEDSATIKSPTSPIVVSAPNPPAETPPPASTSDEPSKTSFKDRLAAFNKGTKSSGSAPPPPLKPKPAGGQGTWAWKQKQAQAQAQPPNESSDASASSGAVAGSTPLASTVSRDEAEVEGGAAGGMSASDAKDSITKGMSLKERMAALAGAGAFGSGDKEKEKKAPPAIGGKPKVWKRPEAPVVSPSVDEVSAPPLGMPQPVRKWSMPVADADDGEASAADYEVNKELTEGADAGVDDEAQKEKERRAAIAARMQKLGGRGIMGGPPVIAPKPVRKPTAEVVPAVKPTEELSDPSAKESFSTSDADPPVSSIVTPADKELSNEKPAPSPVPTAPSSGIILPAMPRRAGPPKRRTGAAGSYTSATPSAAIIAPADDGRSANPPALGDDAEQPLPKSEADQEQERQLERVAGGADAAKGAAAAGIVLEDVPIEGSQQAKETAAAGAAAGDSSALDDQHPGDAAALSTSAAEPIDKQEREIEGAPPAVEEDEVDQENQEDIPPPPPRPMALVPLRDEPSPSSPIKALHTSPSPGGVTVAGLPKDEIELKHDAEGVRSRAHEQDQTTDTEVASSAASLDEADLREEEDLPPPPPPARPVAIPASPNRPSEHPAGPRAMPRTPSSARPAATQDGLVSLQDVGQDRLADRAAVVSTTEVSRQSQVDEGAPAESSDALNEAPKSVDSEVARRQGIAARMAKLGGIKLGGPPLIRTRALTDDDPAATGTEAEAASSPLSPTQEKALLDEPKPSQDEVADDSDETEEAAAKRRQATLARLRAGGSLGYGMFNNTQGGAPPESPTAAEGHVIPEPDVTSGDEEEAAPPPPPRSGVPTSSLPPPPMESEVDAEDDGTSDTRAFEDAPPVPSRLSSDVPRRTASSRSIESIPPSPIGIQRSGSVASRRSIGLAPPLPVNINELAAEPTTYSASPNSPIHDTLPEGNEDVDDDDDAPPPPPVSRPPGHPVRSESRASRTSRRSFQSRRSIDVPPQSPSRSHSMSAGAGRPGYAELQQAAAVYGAKVIRAANALGGNNRATVGDGSSRALVWQAMSDAGLDANKTFGTLILEQESQSVQQRYDEPRAGDVVVLHDCKLSGKKLLKAYTQNFGSVQEPLFGICAEYEGRKNKLTVLTIEKGHPATESLRIEDLKSGLIRVFRPMP